MGRFISEDPVGHGNNWFTYCDSNPVNEVDADGKIPILLVGLLVGLVAGAIADLAYQAWHNHGSIDWYEVAAMAVGGAAAGALLTGIAVVGGAVALGSTMTDAAMAVATFASSTNVGLAFTAWALGMGVISSGVAGLTGAAVMAALGRNIQAEAVMEVMDSE